MEGVIPLSEMKEIRTQRAVKTRAIETNEPRPMSTTSVVFHNSNLVCDRQMCSTSRVFLIRRSGFQVVTQKC